MMYPRENFKASEAGTGPGPRSTGTGETLCIEWLEQSAACVSCGGAAGRGPVGWRKAPDPGPVCDRCLFDRHPDFGLLLFMTHILRETGRMARGDDDPARREEAMNILINVAQIYDLATTKRWPGRAAELMAVMKRSRGQSESH